MPRSAAVNSTVTALTVAVPSTPRAAAARSKMTTFQTAVTPVQLLVGGTLSGSSRAVSAASCLAAARRLTPASHKEVAWAAPAQQQLQQLVSRGSRGHLRPEGCSISRVAAAVSSSTPASSHGRRLLFNSSCSSVTTAAHRGHLTGCSISRAAASVSSSTPASSQGRRLFNSSCGTSRALEA